ncbi:nuclear transport factor 2 family protein [Amycolatopsis sp.]|uniref:nuclear transport factor 2 family protein n=1 Tax=Amycolatopsis sp. TaxID=37632 RepID=UPI002E01CFB7|nr:nuclear transport factor 2 family protein [Amycolatopsis sp.]
MTTKAAPMTDGSFLGGTPKSLGERKKTISTTENKQVVHAFLDLAFNAKKPEEAFDRYVGPGYVQHNPHAPDTAAESARFLAGFVGAYPGMTLEIKRTVAEDDLVVTHSLLKTTPDERGTAIADLMRVRDGRIVEHWDVAQPVPEAPANDNTMF